MMRKVLADFYTQEKIYARKVADVRMSLSPIAGKTLGWD